MGSRDPALYLQECVNRETFTATAISNPTTPHSSTPFDPNLGMMREQHLGPEQPEAASANDFLRLTKHALRQAGQPLLMCLDLLVAQLFKPSSQPSPHSFVASSYMRLHLLLLDQIDPVSSVDIDLPEPEQVASTCGDVNLNVGPCSLLCEFPGKYKSCLCRRTASDGAILCSI